MEENYEKVPSGESPIQKNGTQNLLSRIRPAWQEKYLINRVERLLPVDMRDCAYLRVELH